MGISLGGWLALDYAMRRPDRAKSIVVLAPGGIVSKNVLSWALPLLLMGKWGRRKMAERISGPVAANPSPAEKAVADFMAIVFQNMKPRSKSLPAFPEESLKRLTMPVMAILAGRDVFVDLERSKQFSKEISRICDSNCFRSPATPSRIRRSRYWIS